MNRHPALAIVAIFVLPLLYGSFVLTTSFDHGRWSRDAEYDDIGYYLRAYYYAENIRAEGVTGGIKSYWESPPHSPYSNFVATTGFLIFGYRNWAPLVVNFILLIGAAAITFFLFPWRKTWMGLLAVVGVLLTPTMFEATDNFRPDFAYGWVLALSSALLFRCLGEKRQDLWPIAAVATAGAFLVKTSTLPLTVVVIGASTLLGLARAGWNLRHPLRDLPRFSGTLAKLFGLALLLLLPHYIRSGGAIFRYIWGVVFDPQESALWQIDLTPIDRIGAYLWGPWPWHTALPHLWIWILLLVFATVIITIGKDSTWKGRIVHWWAVILITYSVVTINGEKTAFLGLPFFILTLAGALESAAILTQQTFKKRYSGIATKGAVLFALVGGCLLFSPSQNVPDWHDRSDMKSFSQHDANRELLRAVDAREARQHSWRKPRIYFAANEIMESVQMKWVSLAERLPIDSYSNTRLATLEDQIPLMEAADYVLAAPAEMLQREPRFPADFTYDQVMDYLRKSPRFEEAEVFEPLPGVRYFLFENIAANYPPALLEPASGFSPAETDGKDRWWWTDRTATIVITNPTDKPLTVEWHARVSPGTAEGHIFVTTSSHPEDSTEYQLSPGSEYLEPTLQLSLAGNQTEEIRFRYEGDPLQGIGDTRELCIRIHNCWLGIDDYLDPESITREMSSIADQLDEEKGR